MKSFHDSFKKFCSKREVTKELKPLLSVVYNHIEAHKVNLQLLKESLINLMSFLSKPENRTDANCKAVDLFFCIDDHWNKKWDDLPDDYKQALDDIGGCLHDTVSSPEIGKNFDSTLEQLLERIKKLKGQ